MYAIDDEARIVEIVKIGHRHRGLSPFASAETVTDATVAFILNGD